MNVPYSYLPLFELLEKLDMTLDDLSKKKILSSATVEKIATNQQVMISTIAKICIALGCSFDDVVGLNYDYNSNEMIDDGTRNYQLWSKEDDATLIDEYKNGFTIIQMSQSLNRAPGAISSRINKHILSGKLEKRAYQNQLANNKKSTISYAESNDVTTNPFYVEPPIPEKSCDNCMLGANESCTLVRKQLCEDYKAIPYIPKVEKENWPDVGDATRISRRY